MKSILVLCDKGPFGTNTAVEAIRLSSSFLGLGEDMDSKVAFLGDAVLVMKNNLKSDQIGMDSLDDGLEMADLTDLEIILIKEDMEERGMSESDVIDYDLTGFRMALKEVPSTTTDQSGQRPGLPIGVVIVADGPDVLKALLRAGWYETSRVREQE